MQNCRQRDEQKYRDAICIRQSGRNMSQAESYDFQGVAVLEACLSLSRSGAIWANGQKFELSQDAEAQQHMVTLFRVV